MQTTLRSRFERLLPPVDFCSLRFVEERTERLVVRRDVLQPVRETIDRGAMITVHHQGGHGYAATSDLSDAGLSAAIARARTWAERTAAFTLFDPRQIDMPRPVVSRQSPVQVPWPALSDRVELLMQQSRQLSGGDARIVEWAASLFLVKVETLYLTSHGGEAHQHTTLVAPDLQVVAHANGVTQERTLASRGCCQQGGLEVLDRIGFYTAPTRMRDEVLTLLHAPECPTGTMDLLLLPDQMMLQIHESIGHPLELDRILGDERNYAGTSFVTPDMFGTYAYGSPLLNVTFDPSDPTEFATYACDDVGAPAERVFLIRDGLLVRPLGGTFSQARAGLPGTANTRASSWNRPPIDRMANLNIEPGTSSLDALIQSVSNGVMLETNRSWSIDDSRNKFQFGCELGRRIRDGQLGEVVRTPNYRGISSQFWRNLKGVGDDTTRGVYGSPFCGKGEPNQLIRVGHTSPACLFGNVEVFGGA